MQKKENKKKTTRFCPSSSNKPIVVILIMTRYKLKMNMIRVWIDVCLGAVRCGAGLVLLC